MNHYRNLALMYEITNGGLVRNPQELLSLYDREKEIYPLIKEKSKAELSQYIEDYITVNSLSQKSVRLLEESEGIRYMISEGFHDAYIQEFEWKNSDLMLNLNAINSFSHPKDNADLYQITFSNTDISSEQYNQIKDLVKFNLLYTRQSFEPIDDAVKVYIGMYATKELNREIKLFFNAADISIIPLDK